MKDRAKNGASERAGREWGRKARKGFLSLPISLFHFLALVPFLARPNLKFPFLGLFLLRNQTETLAMQAKKYLLAGFPGSMNSKPCLLLAQFNNVS